MGSTVFWGLRPWTELERTPPSIQAKLPREPGPELLWASAGREGVPGCDPQAQLSLPTWSPAGTAVPSSLQKSTAWLLLLPPDGCAGAQEPPRLTGPCASQFLPHPSWPHPSALSPSASSLDATAGVKPEHPRGPAGLGSPGSRGRGGGRPPTLVEGARSLLGSPVCSQNLRAALLPGAQAGLHPEPWAPGLAGVRAAAPWPWPRPG